MKKVLILIPTLKGGGAEKVLIDLLKQLDLNTWQVEVLVLFKGGIYLKDLPQNIQLLGPFLPQFPGNIHLLKLFSPKLLYTLLIKKKYQMMISFLEGPTTRILSGCPEKDTVLINWVHNEFKKVNDMAAPYRSVSELMKTYQKFHQTVFVSKTAQKSFQRDISVPVDKLKVLYNPIDVEKVLVFKKEKTKNKKESTPLKLVTIGRLTYQKGYDRLLPILAKLAHEDGLNFHLRILGEGEDEEALKKMTKSLKLEKYVEFCGYQKNPYEILANADFFICSSRYEGYSTVVTEATLLGVPVLTTMCSGMDEILGGNLGISENKDEAYYLLLKDFFTQEHLQQELTAQTLQRGEFLAKRNNLQPITDFLIKMGG